MNLGINTARLDRSNQRLSHIRVADGGRLFRIVHSLINVIRGFLRYDAEAQ